DRLNRLERLGQAERDLVSPAYAVGARQPPGASQHALAQLAIAPCPATRGEYWPVALTGRHAHQALKDLVTGHGLRHCSPHDRAGLGVAATVDFPWRPCFR